MYRPASRRSGWRLAIALLSSLAALVFGVGIAMGQFTIGIIAWAVGGLPSLVLLMEGKPTRSGPDGDI
jgi:hypothetical protein